MWLLDRKNLSKSGIAAAVALLCLSACANRAAPVDLNAVQGLVANHQYVRATQLLRAFEQGSGGSTQSHRLMIDAQLGLGDGFMAEFYLRKLAQGDIAEVDRKTLLAHSYILRDRSFDAITLLTNQLPKSQWHSETYRIAIWALRNVGRSDSEQFLQAEEPAAFPSIQQLLVEGLAAFPSDAQLLALDARTRLDSDDVEGASGQAGMALAVDPRNFEANLVMAEIALRQNRADDALRHYRAAHTAFPNDPLPKVNIAGILIDQGRLAEARQVVTDGLASHRGLPMLMFQRARIEAQQEDFMAAHRTLNSVWAALENHVPAQILSARVSIGLGHRATAEAMLTRAARDPRFAGDIANLRAELE